MVLSIANEFDIVCRLDRPQNKKQKIATRLLLDKLHEQDFAGPLSSRTSRALGSISRYRVPDILPHMKLVSRTSRLGLLVGFLRILRNGLLHSKNIITLAVFDAQMNLALTHYTGCTIFLFRPGDMLRYCHREVIYLVSRFLLQSLQFGIVVLGFLDAFVYAHHKHRQGSEKS